MNTIDKSIARYVEWGESVCYKLGLVDVIKYTLNKITRADAMYTVPLGNAALSTNLVMATLPTKVNADIKEVTQDNLRRVTLSEKRLSPGTWSVKPPDNSKSLFNKVLTG